MNSSRQGLCWRSATAGIDIGEAAEVACVEQTRRWSLVLADRTAAYRTSPVASPS